MQKKTIRVAPANYLCLKIRVPLENISKKNKKPTLNQRKGSHFDSSHCFQGWFEGSPDFEAHPFQLLSPRFSYSAPQHPIVFSPLAAADARRWPTIRRCHLQTAETSQNGRGGDPKQWSVVIQNGYKVRLELCPKMMNQPSTCLHLMILLRSIGSGGVWMSLIVCDALYNPDAWGCSRIIRNLRSSPWPYLSYLTQQLSQCDKAIIIEVHQAGFLFTPANICTPGIT